jgi:hypothetical protein
VRIVTVERGIVYGGRILPGTDFVLRDARAWWAPGTNDTRSRVHGRVEHQPRLIVGHWTGAHHREGPETARRTVANMNTRRREDGSDMSVSCHFVIGWDGMTFQTADLSVATVHVGDRVLLRRSIGVETAWCGWESQARRLGIDGVHILPRTVAGSQRVRVVRPSDALLASWVRLCGALADGVGVPRVVPPDTTAVYPLARLRRYEGAIEHLQQGNPVKRDAAGLLLDALRGAGWASRAV